MDRAAFFASLRRRDSGIFGTRLTQPQVDGMEAILDAARWYRLDDPRHVANVLAQVYHETGGYMSPIKETVHPGHRNRTPSDATVIARLDRAYARGQLPWVSAPYWRSGWFGRGQIQITHRANYATMGERLDVDLIGNPDLALDPEISARIAVIGMADGMFRPGNRLDAFFNEDTNDVRGARRIVNGPDGTDGKVSGHHNAFLAALRAGGWALPVEPGPPQPTPDDDARDAEALLAYISRLIANHKGAGDADSALGVRV